MERKKMTRTILVIGNMAVQLVQGIGGGRKVGYRSIDRMLHDHCDSPRTLKRLGIVLQELVKVLSGISAEVRDLSFGSVREIV